VKVWLNGKLVDKEQAVLNVYDHGLLYGDGVFEGIRVYNGKVFQGPAHLERLLESARQIRLKMPYTKEQLTKAMDELVRANQEAYIRLVVTRGVGNLGLNPFQCAAPLVFILNDQIQLYPKELYEKGIAVIFSRTLRTSPRMVPPKVKSLNYLNNILAKIEAVDAGVPEALMLNEHGNVAEATGDNVFIVRRGQLLTPPPSAGILIGITRGIVLKLAADLGIPAAEKDFNAAQVNVADECFLTGTAAEVVPVTRIDGKNVGAGAVGPLTRKLMDAYAEFIKNS
jgi:branched-chain amino acid aminotransferase